MTSIAVDQHLNALFANAPTRDLADALRTVADGPRTPATTQAHAWLIDELERRHPGAAEVVADAFLRAELRAMETGEPAGDVDYVETLLSTIPAKDLR
jgi:hypothetical protein